MGGPCLFKSTVKMLPYFRVKGQVNCGGRSVAGSDETVVLVQMLGPESFPLSHDRSIDALGHTVRTLY
jgi:hypothetical protein